jgi:hypothetical protein
MARFYEVAGRMNAETLAQAKRRAERAGVDLIEAVDAVEAEDGGVDEYLVAVYRREGQRWVRSSV